MKQPGQNTQDRPDTLIIHIYNGTAPSTFTLYEDDGETYDYQKGLSSTRTITFDPPNRKVMISAVQGQFNPAWKTLRVAFHSFELKGDLKVNGKKIAMKSTEHSFFEPLAKYDPITDPDSMGSEILSTIEFSFTAEQITIDL